MLGRRQEERGIQIAETVLTALRLMDVRLRDQGQNDPSDQVPVCAERQGEHRLKVEDVLSSAEGTHREVGVVLQRHAEKVGDRILHGLLQPLGIVRALLGWIDSRILRARNDRRYQQENLQTKSNAHPQKLDWN